MTEQQAERMIKLLEEMNEKLKKIKVKDGCVTVTKPPSGGFW